MNKAGKESSPLDVVGLFCLHLHAQTNYQVILYFRGHDNNQCLFYYCSINKFLFLKL